MKVVRFLTAYRMYQPGETAGFPDAEAMALIGSGVAVDPAAPTEPSETGPANGANARRVAIREAILAVDDDDFTQSGKPDVDAVNAAMPDDAPRVTASERDAVWSEMQAID